MSSSQKKFTLTELIHGLEASIQGDAQCVITGVSTIQQAQSGHITFLTNPLYRKYLSNTQASAIILTPDDAKDCQTNAIVCRDPHYTYAKIAAYFQEPLQRSTGIHPSAVIGADCVIHPSASIGANCVLGPKVTVGARAVIGAGTVIGEQVSIGEDTQIDPRVTIEHSVMIGQRVRIASGVVIGSEGFGFARYQGAWHKVPQLGTVEIGDDVDVGANTTIDRGAMGNTVIENGVKLDNLIQVAHNVRIGANTIIAACVAIAGTTTIGKNCMIGGASCFAGHIEVCDNVMMTGMTTVTKSITQPGLYSSGIVGAVPNHEFLKNNARFYRLEQLMQRVKHLESELKTLTERESS